MASPGKKSYLLREALARRGRLASAVDEGGTMPASRAARKGRER